MDGVKIYSLDVSDVTEKEVELWYSQMSESRKLAADRILHSHKRLLKIAADALCRKAISAQCGIPCSEIIFDTAENGKPFAVNAQIKFNLSHSGNLVVCAVSDKEIGIDVEKIRTFNPKAAERFATDCELDFISSTDNGFFRIWTLKEAYFKCIGTGLGADIKNVSFSIDGDQTRCSENGFICFAEDLHKDYICSVCIKE